MDCIKFYRPKDQYGCFSNFAPFEIRLQGKLWPTSEHYFQAQKFAHTHDRDAIRLAASPMIAAQLGRDRRKKLRADWEQVKEQIMLECVRAKFHQHPEIASILLATGNAELIEHTSKDRYWGDGGDGRGRNRLGHILMLVREELRAAVDRSLNKQ